MPVTIKINVDYAGRATTNGVVAFKDRIAQADSPPVANWRRAGAIIIGRTNVPPFSARFFTDNALYGRTLNPWDAGRTPGGSSGGAAAAVATGIGALAHGNDRAGSIRYPAYACGVVGLRPTLGRVPTYEPSAPDEPSITTQLTHVQGPLARSVRDLRLGLVTMAARDPRDPWWVPVPVGLEPPAGEVRAWRCWPRSPGSMPIRRSPPPCGKPRAGSRRRATRSRRQRRRDWRRRPASSSRWCVPEEQAGTTKAIERLGDEALRRARASTMAYASELDFEGYVKAFGRRASILREWMLFFERYPLLLMPVSWQRPFPVDFDQQGDAAVARMLNAHHPMLAVSTLGLPGLSIPTGLVDGVPLGVQLVAGRFEEELCLRAGEVIEARQPMATPIDPRV